VAACRSGAVERGSKFVVPDNHVVDHSLTSGIIGVVMVMTSRASSGDVMLTCAVMTSHVNKRRELAKLTCAWLLEDVEIATQKPVDDRQTHTVWPRINDHWHLTITRPTGTVSTHYSPVI